MKPIEKEALEQLLTIIPDHPQIRLLHFADSGEALPLMLADFAKQRDYGYQLHATDKSYAAQIAPHLPQADEIKAKFFPLSRPRYMQQGKLYDFVFVTTTIEKQMREAFLQRVHPIIKNGGSIMLFIPKGDHTQRFNWMQLLEENYYVASNTIDDLFAHYDLLISRKMHGWGG